MEEYRPKSLLCVVAHPDDIEVCAGGTVAKWAQQGTEVHFLICTDGSRGGTSADISTTRQKEQLTSNKILGAHCVHQLSYPDGIVEYSRELVLDIAKCIRAHKPDAVFTMDPTFYYCTRRNYANHRDHRIIGQATFDAVYPVARDESSNEGDMDEVYEPHSVETLLMTHYDKENFRVDITDSFETKMEALLQHQSQFGNREDFIRDRMRASAELTAENESFELAEGFVKLEVMR